MTEAKPMAELLPGIVDRTGETDSPERSTALAASISLKNLPSRLDDRTLEMVRLVAHAPALRDEPCSPEHFAKCLRSMDLLPRRADDGLSGELRYKLYRAKLGHLHAAALSHLASAALDRCDWFPTIAECLRIIAEWPQVGVGAERRKQAAYLVRRELMHRLDEDVARLAKRDMSQAEIDAMPEQAKRVASEKGFLWAWPDGRFTVRIDVEGLEPDEADRVREANRAMMAEWREIEARQADERAAAKRQDQAA